MMMKKLSEDHYIIMDGSEINIGDIVAEKLLTGEYELFTIHTLNDIDKSTQKKITHSTQPLEWFGGEIIFLSEVKELLGVVDVENKAEQWHNSVDSTYPNVWNRRKESYKAAFESGYYQALEDNKEKKYTEEDMVEAYKMGLMRLSDQRLKDYMLPKTEWEVEFIDGKLQLVKE